MVGLSQKVFVHCPPHHVSVSVLLSGEEKAIVPVTDRVDPASLSELTKFPYLVTCQMKGCYLNESAMSYEDGVARYTNHTCPQVGGASRMGPIMQYHSSIQDSWVALDAAVTELVDGDYINDENERTRLKGVCRGMAEVLARFMRPHFETADQISAEAARRYKARKAGTEYVTPGLEPRVMARPPAKTETKYETNAVPKKAAGKPAGRTFTDNEIQSMKKAHATGMMNISDLAKMFKVHETVIAEIVGE